jgi:hypothetical protein
MVVKRAFDCSIGFSFSVKSSRFGRSTCRNRFSRNGRDENVAEWNQVKDRARVT